MKITIGENEIHRTSVSENEEVYNVGDSYTSKSKIKKDTKIIIEIFDADDKIQNDNPFKLLLKIVATPVELVKTSYYCLGKKPDFDNCAEVVSLWQNERKKGKPKGKEESLRPNQYLVETLS